MYQTSYKIYYTKPDDTVERLTEIVAPTKEVAGRKFIEDAAIGPECTITQIVRATKTLPAVRAQ